MFERFTARARKVVVLAQDEARELDHPYVGTEHLLIGLLREGGGVAAVALGNLGVSADDIRVLVKETIGPGASAPSGHIPFTPRVKKVLEISLREALQLGHNYIGTEHLLLAVVREGEGVAARALVKSGADLPRVRQQIIFLLSGYKVTPTSKDDFMPDRDDAEDLAALMISGLLAGEHAHARRILDGLRRMGWRPPTGP